MWDGFIAKARRMIFRLGDLRARETRLRDRIERLESINLALKEKNISYFSRMKEYQEALNNRNVSLNLREIEHDGFDDRKIDYDLEHADLRQQLKTASLSRRQMEIRLDNIREKHQDLASRARRISQNNRLRGQLIASLRPFNRFLVFAQRCAEQAEKCKSDVYVAHGVQSLPAAAHLASGSAARLVCDCIETPSFFDRALPTLWGEVNTQYVDHAHEGYLRKCDAILTVGWTLGRELERFAVPVSVIPNYRNIEDTKTSLELKRWCGIDDEVQLALAISTITRGFETLLEGFARLKHQPHLAVIGNVKPDEYRSRCNEKIKELGLTDRVHFFQPVEYATLAALASGADIGIIILEPDIKNHRVALPNRVFDYIAAGLPIIAPEIEDIAEIVERNEIGRIVKPLTANGWREALQYAFKNKTEMKSNVRRAAAEMCWENVEAELYQALGEPKSVTFVGMPNLLDNNRTMRMCQSLSAMGVSVTVLCPNEKKKRVVKSRRMKMVKVDDF